MPRRSKGEGSLFQTTDGKWRGFVTMPDGKRKSFRATSRALADQRRKQLILERDNYQPPRPEHEQYTVGEWVNHWIAATSQRHTAATTAGYKYAANHYPAAEFLNIPLDQLTIGAVEAEYDRMLANALAGSTRHQVHAILSGAFNSAVKRGLIPMNPAAYVENKPKIQSKPVESLSFADVARLETALEHDAQKARWMVALGLGLRPGEARGLEWHHLDWEAKTLAVGQQVQTVDGKLIVIDKSKTVSGNRVIPVPNYLLEILREHRITQLQRLGAGDMWKPDSNPRSWMFTQLHKPGMPVTHNSDKTNWKNILDRAGIPHVKPYVTRHTAASILIAHNVDPITVAEILGHSDANFTIKTYVHSIDERKRQAADILDAARRPNSPE